MPNEVETPSSVMYGCMKQFASIKNNELARTLFSDSFNYGGAPMKDRLGERTLLSRTVVRAAPGDFPESAFSDFPGSAISICANILAKYPNPEGKGQVVDYFAGEACNAMCAALQGFGLNDTLYRNMCTHLEQMNLPNESDKATLLILLFISAGCLGDPACAAEITQQFSRRIASSGFRTSIARDDDLSRTVGSPETDSRIGLCRIVGGKLRMPAYLLSTDPEGTEIGSLSTAKGAINDVDATVSKRHVRIFRDADGHWYAEGLGSTNGTTVIRGETKWEEVVEPPRSRRQSNAPAMAVPIFPSDTLCLANSTRFLVLEIA